ncbi:hypothetical protein INS49_008970 [Diaporthe citri]|uniref:uncharacterized protein n=1 Tax=Diaporthe citri TaxID=83186 RepID=UPI001C7F9C13|nr:uncharacterized protein INS49_008970 [Diaporthe citri]KAG6363867.1 hypothetical protein INS49_008970 [Diaporthe citri]
MVVLVDKETARYASPPPARRPGLRQDSGQAGPQEKETNITFGSLSNAVGRPFGWPQDVARAAVDIANLINEDHDQAEPNPAVEVAIGLVFNTGTG